MSTPKIYNLTDHWYPDKIGGSCIYAYRLHRLLSPRARIETITLIGDPSPYEQNMVVHKVLHKWRLWQNRRTLRAVAHDSDAVWLVHSPWFFLHLFLAFGFGLRNRVVGVYHGPWYREYYHSANARKNIFAKVALSSFRYIVEIFYSWSVKRFIFLSETMYLATSEYLPVSRSKAHIIPMWSEKDSWDLPRPRHEPLTLSTFRRLEPRMGLQDFIGALRRCDLASYRFVICGDGPFKNDLIDLIEESNHGSTVDILGWVTEEEKTRLIEESDAVVIPSRNLEGFSLLALESLEKGTPVLLTEAVGFYEYVRHIDQDFVKRIDLDEPELELQEFLCQGSARSGLERLESIFNADRIREQLLAVLIPEGCQT